jgi:hypothetical protein
MRSLPKALLPLASVGAALCATPQMVQAADLPARPPVFAAPAPAVSEWSFRFTPYGWAPSMNGTQTIRGRSAKVDASFIDVLEKSDSLIGLMGDVEIRNGPIGLLGDFVWSKVGLSGDTVRTRSVAPGINASIGASAGLDVQMVIAEVGVAYEIARYGSLAFDVIGGGRFWWQKADLSLDLTGTLDIGDLQVVGGRAISRSGSVDWADPLVGGRIRYELAPGHQLSLRGDVGGFGVGSDFSWQAIAAYGWDFARYNNITFSGVLGYRALYVDYAQGQGRSRYEFDMLQHGPVVGISARF